MSHTDDPTGVTRFTPAAQCKSPGQLQRIEAEEYNLRVKCNNYTHKYKTPPI